VTDPAELLVDDVDDAVALLRAGGLVAIPTETVYGLGADAENPAAVARVYAAKGRPVDHPLIVHLARAEQIDDGWAREVPDWARLLAAACWPGPLTLVLRRGERAGDHVTGGQDTVGLRVPAHPVTHDVLARFGGGVAAPSANRFGRVSPTDAVHVLEELAGLLVPGTDGILVGGASEVGVESTIVDCTGEAPRLLRPGAVGIEELEAVTGLEVGEPDLGVRAPGTLASHYAPQARVELCTPDALSALAARTDQLGQPEAAAQVEHGADTGLIAPADLPTPADMARLAAPHDAADYARSLYAALRSADAAGLARVLVVPPAGEDALAHAVRDRLRRAAHPDGPPRLTTPTRPTRRPRSESEVARVVNH
jgi:L-threonylcarbamoyladenylate synthase